jgi:hypothetical protein
MGEAEVFQPRSAGRAVAVIAFPLLSAVCVLIGVVAVLRLSPIVGMILFIAFLLLGGVPLLVMAAVLRGSFTLNVDDEALTMVGVLGGRVRLAWVDQAAVGLTSWRGATMLAVRPVEPPRRAPRRSMDWDRESGLLMITGLDNWSAPRDEVVDAVRSFAGELWTPSFDVVRPH